VIIVYNYILDRSMDSDSDHEVK